ncbi:hypothetical protein ACOQFV_08910 [Nocardiopsis changdeensis]|uniref:DUF222 domain-containing protein n=1 Tax=Nocardiopsis changdeensis TaxID=2831969 RepID=A0ABX8BE74_9ACTN|nr:MULTISPECIES: hypothetical protein [Nocardiopsis]QUX20337.1 hypothetical protein KGD84_17570 [Nocardiopsis changdeensis]QYX36267.1 hypothetical protein K1J57_27025 [Nocardiopsis sp. MT53]
MATDDLLRRAARRLRETSGDADTWTWLTATAKAVTAIANRDPDVHQSHHGRAPELAVSDHLAVFSPLVGTTLADWLDLTAERVEERQWSDDGPMVARALAVARAITLEDLNDALAKEN